MRNVEEEVLSALMFDGGNMSTAIERGVLATWFSDAKNGELYGDLVAALSKTEWNNRNAVNVLESTGIYAKHPHAVEICGSTPEWAFRVEEVESAVEVLAGEYAKRLVETVNADTRNRLLVGDDPFDVAGSAAQEFGNIDALVDVRHERTTRQIADAAYALDEQIFNGATVGLPFPWESFQRKTYGLPLKAVTPLAGRDGAGKSRLAAFLIEFWIRQEIPTLYFAFEDTAERAVGNVAATHGGYDAFQIKDGKADAGFMANHRTSLRAVAELPLYLEDAAMTPERLVGVIARHKRKHGVQAVVIDGVKDLIIDGKESLVERENKMMGTLVRAAKKYDVAILAVMHLRDISDTEWITKRAIRGSKILTQSSRMTLMYQDAGIPPRLQSQYAINGDGEIILDCQKCSYGNRAYAVLRPELHTGQFAEILPGGTRVDPRPDFTEQDDEEDELL